MTMRWTDRFFGRGRAAVTVPSMDGALRPNSVLDRLDGVPADAPDCLALHRGEAVVSGGSQLRALDGGAVLHDFGAPVTAMAATVDTLFVAVEGMGLFRIGDDGPQSVACPVRHITALACDGEDLLICEGSARYAPSDWRLCLMRRGAYGRDDGAVHRLKPGGALETIARDLGWPAGIAVTPERHVVVSEAWASRLVDLATGKPVLLDLPGYPGRMTPAAAGGYWLTVFAPRSQLIEFVLREDAYRRRMVEEVPAAYWIAPALANGHSFLEPLQGGAVKQMGILKPWAPTRSYGLLVRLDASFQPAASFHSRADGMRHGLTHALETGGTLLIACKGGGEVLSMPIDRETSR